MVQDFRAVIDSFGGVTAFADAVGMKPNTVKVARHRNSLSPEWFAQIARAAEGRDLQEITLEVLVGLAEARRTARAA